VLSTQATRGRPLVAAIAVEAQPRKARRLSLSIKKLF
jgi:hypothetical protein